MCFLFDVIFITENRVRLGEILKRLNDQKQFSKLFNLFSNKTKSFSSCLVKAVFELNK